MPYTPDPENENQPSDSEFAGTAAAEFRALKGHLKTKLADVEEAVALLKYKTAVLLTSGTSYTFPDGTTEFLAIMQGGSTPTGHLVWVNSANATGGLVSIKGQVAPQTIVKKTLTAPNLTISYSIGDAMVIGRSFYDFDCLTPVGNTILTYAGNTTTAQGASFSYAEAQNLLLGIDSLFHTDGRVYVAKVLYYSGSTNITSEFYGTASAGSILLLY